MLVEERIRIIGEQKDYRAFDSFTNFMGKIKEWKSLYGNDVMLEEVIISELQKEGFSEIDGGNFAVSLSN